MDCSLQAPLSMGFSSKNTGVGCHTRLQGIFPTQGSNHSTLHWQADSSPLSHQGSSTQPQIVGYVHTTHNRNPAPARPHHRAELTPPSSQSRGPLTRRHKRAPASPPGPHAAASSQGVETSRKGSWEVWFESRKAPRKGLWGSSFGQVANEIPPLSWRTIPSPLSCVHSTLGQTDRSHREPGSRNLKSRGFWEEQPELAVRRRQRARSRPRVSPALRPFKPWGQREGCWDGKLPDGSV